MEKSNREKFTNDTKKLRKKNIKNIFVILIKSILCMTVLSIAILINIDKEKRPSSNTESNEYCTYELGKESSEVKEDDTDAKNIKMVNDNRGVPVICYHSVSGDLAKKGPIIIPKDKFREQLKTIKDNGYITLTMEQLYDYLYKDKPIPEKSVVITFDDGYRDNYTEAFPILKEFNMKATIFVISSYINRNLYLTTDQIKEMNDYGVDIESHTVSHNNLNNMSYKDQLRELKNSKETLENITKKPVISVAYPEGKYNKNTKKAVGDANYSMGFTIERGYADRNDNFAQLNRICVDYTYKPYNILNILKNLRK